MTRPVRSLRTIAWTHPAALAARLEAAESLKLAHRQASPTWSPLVVPLALLALAVIAAVHHLIA